MIRLCGIFCICGVLTGIIWAMINSISPNSSGSTMNNDFVILRPFLHRLEHASAALLVFPGIFAGLFGYYLSGAAGKGWIGKILLTLAAIGAVSASGGSLFELLILQSETADLIRGFSLTFILLMLCPLLFGIAALIYRKIPLWKRILPLLLPVWFFLTFSLIIGVFRMSENWAVAGTFVGWLIFGHAVYTEGTKAREETLV